MRTTASPLIQSRNGNRFTKYPYNNAMPGERNLDVLLRAIAPALHPGEFVYCSAPAILGDPVCAFPEPEGWTLILPREDAQRLGLACTYPCRMITLTVHSSLEAVGLLAVIATRLAAHGISVNVV